MALNDSGASQSRDEHIAAFLEVLRESMGDNSLNDDELLEFARSDTFKEMFPDLVAGIPVLQEILNEGSKNDKPAGGGGKVDDKSSPIKENENSKSGRESPEIATKDIKKEKNVITLSSSDSSSSVMALSDIPKGSKSVSSSTKMDSKSKPKEVSVDKVKKEKTKDLESEVKKERRESTNSHSTTKEKEDKPKHSAASTSTVVATKKDFDKYKPLMDVSRKSKNWKPTYDEEYEKYRRKYNLETHVVILCDLQSFKSVFHGPDGADPTAPLFSATVPLKHNMVLAPEKVKIISGIESNKRSTCARELKRRFAIKLKEERKQKQLKKVTTYSSSDSDEEEFKKLINARKRKEAGDPKRKVEKKKDSSDDERNVKKRKRNKRVLGSSSSESDAPAASKKTKPEKEEEKSKKSQPDKKREHKNKHKKKEEPVKIPSHMKWEKKPDYFVQERDDKEEIAKKAELPRKIISVSELLARTAQNVPSSVALKIPKKTDTKEMPRSMAPQPSVMLSEISNHVKKVLNSETVIEMPVMGDVRHLYDITVQKIAWWFLKWEEDPPKVEIFHPELHDVVYRPLKDGYESDDSIGHVSDPDGLNKPVFDPKAIRDPDVADEYCGYHSLEVKIRVAADGVGNENERFMDCFKQKPGTNYHRSTFQVKCLVCAAVVIKGARGLGTHIRSSAHANNFRNKSLDLANYSEFTEDVAPDKIFKATLKTYGKGEDYEPDLPDYLLKALNDQPESTLVSSPKLVLDESSSFFDIKEDPMLLEIKEAMIKHNKWAYYLEQKWCQATAEEKKIVNNYLELREKYKKAPDTHPKFTDEWNEFWYDRFDEVERSGQDADNYNYHAEWDKIKVGRILRIVKQETEDKILEMRQNIRMDYSSLSRLMHSTGVVLERKPKVQQPVTSITLGSSSAAPSSSQPVINAQNRMTHSTGSKFEMASQFHEDEYAYDQSFMQIEAPSQPMLFDTPPIKIQGNFSTVVTAQPPRGIYQTPSTPFPQAIQPPPLPQAIQPPPFPQGIQPPPFPQEIQPPPLPQAIEAPPLPEKIETPPLPKGPPMPSARPPLPKRPPTPPKISELENLELQIAKGKEQLKRLAAMEKGKRAEKEVQRSRSKSRERSRRSKSRDRNRRSRSRSRNRRRSRDRERRRSRSWDRRSRSRERKRSRSRHRRNSRPRDRERRKTDKDIRSVERGRTSTETKEDSYETERNQLRRADSPPLSIVSPERDGTSLISDKSNSLKSIPSPPASKVSSNDFDFGLGTTHVRSFLTKLEAARAKRKNSQPELNDSPPPPTSTTTKIPEDVDHTPVDMELEEGELSPPPPPGTEDFSAPKRDNPIIPKVANAVTEIRNKPMKRCPPPPILSGSNSLSSVSSGEPTAPGTAKVLLPTPNTQPTPVLTSRGRGGSWTNSYRGAQNNSSGSHTEPMGHSVPVHTTSTSAFRGRVLHRGRGGYRGAGHMPHYPSGADAGFPAYQPYANPYTYINPTMSQHVPNLVQVDPSSIEQVNMNAGQNPYSDPNMYPPATPYTEW